MAARVRGTIEAAGDRVTDLHFWRLGPGHAGLILSVLTPSARDADWYKQRLAGMAGLSHVTVEVVRG